MPYVSEYTLPFQELRFQQLLFRPGLHAVEPDGVCVGRVVWIRLIDYGCGRIERDDLAHQPAAAPQVAPRGLEDELRERAQALVALATTRVAGLPVFTCEILIHSSIARAPRAIRPIHGIESAARRRLPECLVAELLRSK